MLASNVGFLGRNLCGDPDPEVPVGDTQRARRTTVDTTAGTLTDRRIWRALNRRYGTPSEVRDQVGTWSALLGVTGHQFAPLYLQLQVRPHPCATIACMSVVFSLAELLNIVWGKLLDTSTETLRERWKDEAFCKELAKTASTLLRGSPTPAAAVVAQLLKDPNFIPFAIAPDDPETRAAVDLSHLERFARESNIQMEDVAEALAISLQASMYTMASPQERMIYAKVDETQTILLHVLRVTLDTFAEVQSLKVAPRLTIEESMGRHEVLESDQFLETLTGLYGDHLFEFNGWSYPIYVHSTCEGVTSPDDLLGGLDRDYHSIYFDPEVHDPRFRDLHLRKVAESAHAARAGGRPGDLVGFALDSIDLGSAQPTLRCKYGTYALAQATSFPLDGELLDALASDRTHIPSLEDLPARARVHAFADNKPLTNGRGRCAEVAVSVLTVVETNPPQILLLRRSREVATDPLRLHVAPAGKFQRVGELPYGDDDPQFSLSQTIWREFAEELLGIDEAEGDERYLGGPEWDIAPVRELQSLWRKGELTLRTTGLVSSLTDLQPEVLALCVVHDPNWLLGEGLDPELRPKLKPNWEFLRVSELPPEDRRRFRTPLTESLDLPSDALQRLRPSALVSRAAAAVELGLKAYKQMRQT